MPSANAATVKQMTSADLPAVIAALARAFTDDPVSKYLIPSDRRRTAGLRRFFGIQIRGDLLPFGGCYTTGNHAGAALWAPPGKPPPPALRSILALLPVAPYVAGRHPSRAIRFLTELQASHPKEPHWYLATLGTDPAHQGKGVGSALLQPVLERCDKEGTRAYLESSKERNIPLYERHGFTITRELRLAGGPPIWAMWREPQPPA